MPLITEAASRDNNIAKSEYLATFRLEMPGRMEALHGGDQIAKESKFIVDAVDGANDGDDHNADQLSDSVCAICDDGGQLLPCEGRCMRSFHATVDAGAGAESLCGSLGYTDAQFEAIQNFLCQNCQHQQHQCFACGILGSSDKSSGAKVFPCVSATCGHFYHPGCVAKLLHPLDAAQAEKVQRTISAGESFTCPAHKCFICKQGEDKKVYDLQFAICRRCPKAYHRKCLPKKISFERDLYKNIPQRAWEGLLPNRILIYCMEHKIIPGLRTPERNHILFPSIEGKKKGLILKLKLAKLVLAEKRITKALPENCTASGSVTDKTIVSMHKKVKCTAEAGSAKNIRDRLHAQSPDSRVTNATMKSSRMNNMTVQEKACTPAADKSKSSLGYEIALLNSRSHAVKCKEQQLSIGKTKKTISAMPVMKEAGSKRPLIDKQRIVTLMEDVTSSFNSEEFMKKQKLLCNTYSRSVVDKTMTMGKVEIAIKAVQAALKKLEEGCTVEDAKTVCEPEVLKQVVKWKTKLGVYLAPFLHGMRYTSFGRHFTKLDKLKEIVDRLCWYVQDGDMVVDFCCGSNDFSCLLKEKLEQMGKSCSFRNYDLIQTKNNFNFEKRDWMTVGVEELPEGSQLIMGLNPPFGVHATRANQFIEKALEFKPKLLILIVPQETKRLDRKNPPYDLIWEDDSVLSGKSFYLPGSVNVQDQQIEQWNLEPPPLYLWSRPDWTAKHKQIAREHGHLPKKQEETVHAEPKHVGRVVSNYLMEDKHDCFGDFSNLVSDSDDLSRMLEDVPEFSEKCVNMELSTPTNYLGPRPRQDLQPSFSRQHLQYGTMYHSSVPGATGSVFENRPQGGFWTCANTATPGPLQNLQPNLSRQHLQYGAMFRSFVPGAPTSAFGQMKDGNLPTGPHKCYNGFSSNG